MRLDDGRFTSSTSLAICCMDTLVSLPSAQFKVDESFQGSIENDLRTRDDLHDVVVDHLHCVVNGNHPFADVGHSIVDTGDARSDTGDSIIDSGNSLIDSGDSLIQTGDSIIDTGDALIDTSHL